MQFLFFFVAIPHLPHHHNPNSVVHLAFGITTYFTYIFKFISCSWCQVNSLKCCTFTPLNNTDVLAWLSMIWFHSLCISSFAVCHVHALYFDFSGSVLFPLALWVPFSPSESYMSLKVYLKSQMPWLLWSLPYILCSPQPQELEGIFLPLSFQDILSELFLWPCCL